MSRVATSAPEYVLGHSRRELDRLTAQARSFEPFTRQLLLEAGLEPGMRVLDVGAGAGDVTLLAAELVGPGGTVIGIDKAPQAVAVARQRASALGVMHVEFREGDAAEMTFDTPFDAVIGRLVLMYSHEPAKVLKKLAASVRPGGIVAFQEFDISGARSIPPAPTFDRSVELLTRTFAAVGSHTSLGSKLYPTFLAAGLPSPTLRLDGLIGGGPDAPLYEVVTDVTRSVLPVMIRLGIATAEAVDIDTLEDRLRQEVVRGGGVVTSPTLIGAWSRK
jgi:ubiquinone/menaquinone biosynthesis C-methylase UbiE